MKNLHFIFLVIFGLCFFSLDCLCQVVPVCNTCNQIINSDEEIEGESGEVVCLQGDFVLNEEINLDEAVLCIGSDVEVNLDEGFGGEWTIYNYGEVTVSGEWSLSDGQSFYNYGSITVEDDNETNFQLGSYFYNEGTANFTGDIINFGEMVSIGILFGGNEFKNLSTGVASILNMTVFDEITNDNIINLSGVIESVTKSFKNGATGTVNGTGEPCVMIKVALDVENVVGGVLDGSSGEIILNSELESYSRGGAEVPGVYAIGVEEEEENITGECFSRLAAVLPVLWDGFSAEYSTLDKSIVLDWSTSKEWENSHFEIERSVDGVREYLVVGRVDAVGWSDLISYYSYIDTELPINAERLYYRVKQVDINGSYSYSKTLMVSMPDVNYTHGVWKVYPNPTKGELLKLVLTKKEQYKGELISFRVFDTINATAYQKVASLTELNQYLAETVKNFSNGLIVVELRWGESVEYIKVINK